MNRHPYTVSVSYATIAARNLMNLPHLSISFTTGDTSKLELSVDNCTIPAKTFDNERSTLFIIGSPVLGESIVYNDIWAQVTDAGLPSEFLKNINGEFLLITLDKQSGTLRVSSDRYTSIPLFYVVDDSGFYGSVFYKDVWEYVIGNNSSNINKYAVFEFLWLQRLLGTKTYDLSSSFLLAASTVTYRSGSATTDRYWVPSFEKTSASVKDSAKLLSGLIRQSIRRKTSDNPGRIGLFLSGGIDSRTALSSFEHPPVSFTIGVTDNNEVKVARKIANSVQSRHKFIAIDQDPYSSRLDELTMLGGGMHAFDHAIFYGLKQQISSDADVVFHGHGIDYMFQGMYLLNRNLNFLGRRTSFKRAESIGPDFPGEYINRIGHRLKDIALLDYVVANRRDEMMGQLRHSVEEILESGEGFCQTPDDQWEYMLIHGLARHYPFTNLTSMGTTAEQRIIAFDNDIFDLYLSLPKSHRLDGKIAKETLKILNPKLASIPTANTNQSPNQSAIQKDAIKLIQLVKRRTGLEQSPRLEATPEERTWPDRGRMFATQPKLTEAAMALRSSDALASLDFLDMDRLAKDIPTWLESPTAGPGAFMTFLVTIDRFIKYGQ
jgi:asparagine synthetase B (glutamine-hydrolysing)